ncbi:FecR domain-containing protein [Aggregicoccus sp. 17bor-14]|uniref:FecR domain-containing protein n=1 Tax=Myxococcaceae TaxID=31 RepID=UPI00129CFB75|nr:MULTISPECIES: FecR domain-containing protein [Myxococcaceae]MBF5044473.1 FecR domain-containing protein [Simulacricoccus sp. 17bor-14]MRI90218.1 FecR domain-containing protein [Aggregicoccus sp. 17bor-14]
MALLCALAAPVGCSPGAPPPPPEDARPSAPAQPPRAHLRSVKGGVLLKRAAGDEWVSAQEGQALYENDKVRTVAGASALVAFVNGSELSLGESALVGIAETRPAPGRDRSDVTVLRGRVDAELQDPERQSLTVSTPAATVKAGREIVFQ